MKSPGTHRLSLPALFALGAAALLMTGAALSACIPPGDCTGDCEEATGVGGSGGGNNGGNSQAGSGGGGSGAKSDPPADLPVENCSAHPTIAKVEADILVKTCGLSVCHGSKTATDRSDLKSPGIALRLIGVKPKMICQDDQLIDPDAPEKSILLRKLEDSPKCNNGDGANEKMPSTGNFTAEDKTCLENYVKALATWNKM